MSAVMEVDRSLPIRGQSHLALPIQKQINPMHLSTLVLNADYQPTSIWPLSLIPAPDAITDFYKERAQIVETWKDAFGNDVLFRSPSMAIPAPKVLVLNQYVSISTRPKFSRRSVILRDRFCCQYCGKRFISDDLTFDHVIPKSKGGRTEWTNILMACSPCNLRKADRPADWSAPTGHPLRPLKEPKVPSNNELLKSGLVNLPDRMKETWADWLYWNVELDP